MSRTALKEIVNKMIIKDRIQRVYASCAAQKVALTQFKRKHGYCGGSPSCMEFTGEVALCRRCLDARKNPKSKRPVYEYGQIRSKERAEEKKAVAKKKAAVTAKKKAA